MRASEFWFFRINYLCTIQIQDGNGIKTDQSQKLCAN